MIVRLSQCPATRTLVSQEFCEACEQHTEGVGCPNLSRVVPKVYCVSGECPHNKAGRCESQMELERTEREEELPREVAEVWDSEAPLCSYPRMIQFSLMTVEV